MASILCLDGGNSCHAVQLISHLSRSIPQKGLKYTEGENAITETSTTQIYYMGKRKYAELENTITQSLKT
jgi:hypothetical protein